MRGSFGIIAALAMALSAGAARVGVWFDGACPSSWTEEPLVRGRLVVSVTNGSQGGFTVNEPLTDMEDRKHLHSTSATTTLASKDVSGASGSDHTSAEHGAQTGQNASDLGASGLGFVQYSFCLSPDDGTVPDLPPGAVAFMDFGTFSCPSGFVPLEDSAGRLLVPSHDTEITKSDEPPLADREDRAHAHGDDGACSISTQPTDYEGVGGCCNGAPSASGTYPVSVDANASTTGLPYVQALTCGAAGKSGATLPQGALLFATSELGCWEGWEIADDVGGRFLVGTPLGGTNAGTFGGSPVPRGSSSGVTHGHDLHGSIVTQPAGVELIQGCCAKGYAENGSYEYACGTDQASSGLPYLMLPLCRQSSSALRGA